MQTSPCKHTYVHLHDHPHTLGEKEMEEKEGEEGGEEGEEAYAAQVRDEWSCLYSR